jgi:large subunit ribosomal protein L24
MQKIRKGDKVVVLAGKDKGRTGEVIRMLPKDDKAVVRGINVVRRHQKQNAVSGRRHHFQGGADPRFQHRRWPTPRTASRPASASQVEDGKKVRVAKRSGEVIDG